MHVIKFVYLSVADVGHRITLKWRRVILHYEVVEWSELAHCTVF